MRLADASQDKKARAAPLLSDMEPDLKKLRESPVDDLVDTAANVVKKYNQSQQHFMKRQAQRLAGNANPLAREFEIIDAAKQKKNDAEQAQLDAHHAAVGRSKVWVARPARDWSRSVSSRLPADRECRSGRCGTL